MLDQTNPLAVLKKGGELSLETMHTWSDERRKEFKGTFEQRTKAAQFILEQTAATIVETAERRKFISEKHTSRLHQGRSRSRYGHLAPTANLYHWLDDGQSDRTAVGGRNYEELAGIANERAKQILKELPSLKTAVQVIDKETAKKIDERDALLKKGQVLTQKLEDLSEPIELSDVDQKMTIGDFRAEMKKRAKERRRTLEKLNEIGREGCSLEDEINKALYAGLPGLSDAVIKVVKDYQKRADAMQQMCRRVTEQVMFGDSAAATDLLKRFEQDEVEMDGHIKADFSAAMDKLKAAAKKSSKTSKKIGTKKKKAKKKGKKK